MSETRLTPEAQKEIQRFMWKAVMIPAIPASFILFLGGFFINDIFKVKAENTAFSEAYSNLQKLSQETTEARFEAETAKKNAENAALEASRLLREANKIWDDAKRIQTEAEDIRSRLQRTESFQKSEQLVQEIKNALREDQTFITETVDHTNKKLAKFAREINALSERFQFLPASEYKVLWNAETKRDTENVSAYVPQSAKAVLLNVIVNTGSDSGSFVCADPEGQYNNAIAHYANISVTEYGDKWSGGLVICPLTEERTFSWKLVDNQNSPSNKVSSYGSLVGWW